MESNKSILILAVVGMPATGKSEVLKTLVTDYGFFHIYYGDITFDELKKRGLEVNEVNERIVREDLRSGGDLGIYSKYVLPKIENAIKNGYKKIILESMYNVHEYEVIKDKYGESLKVLAIHSDRDLRLKRLRERKNRKLTETELESREISEAKKLYKGTLIALADYHYINNGEQMKVFENNLNYFFKYKLKINSKLETIESFSSWSKIKENLDYVTTEINGEQILNLREGEVRWCQIGLNVGDEAKGKGEFFTRPVLIFKKLSTNTFLGLPTTSKVKSGSWYFNLNKLEVKTIILNQVKLIDKRRLGLKIVELTEEELKKVKKAFKDFI